MSKCKCCEYPDIDKIDNMVKARTMDMLQAAKYIKVSYNTYRKHFKKHQSVNVNAVVINPVEYSDMEVLRMNNSMLQTMNEHYNIIINYYQSVTNNMTEDDKINYYISVIIPLIDRMSGISERITKTKNIIKNNNTNVDENKAKELVLKWIGENKDVNNIE